ncbi:MAG TPA: TolC family protein [Pirellulaceae bacterium]|nr:TolC family protein [Pirellulaceae bacterium]
MLRIGTSQVTLGFAFALFAVAIVAGCRNQRHVRFDSCAPVCSDAWQSISYPQTCFDDQLDASDVYSGPPPTISNFEQTTFLDLTLEDTVRMALEDSKVLQRVGGVVVNAPQGAATVYDLAIVETDPRGGVEAALSEFDAQVATSLFYNHSERKFNNIFFGGGAPTLTTDSAAFRAEVSKQTAAGTRFAARNLTDYSRNDSPFNRFPSVWDTVNQFEVRQPLLRGSGVTVNRIAGPQAIPGIYNGVLIARIRSDISLADFEASVRDLVRDVERSYWELYFAYRDLNAKMAARDAARETWENRRLRLDAEVGRPDEEAQARQQYYSFEAQVQNALVGTAGLPGVLSAERNLRRLLGLPVSDGAVIRPVSSPAAAPIVFDWDVMQAQMMEQSVEIRRQKWNIKQRELELLAAKQLNLWRLDLVGQYGFRGFGDNLFGSRSRPEGSAVADLWTGKLDDWQIGVDLQGPIGNRQGHLAIRNAELRLIRDKAIMREQQKQLLHDLGAAYAEVDRAHVNISTSYNAYIAATEELMPKRRRVEEGRDQVFFLLDAQQRVAAAESAFHRSVVDYNLALMNFTYISGSLLSRYNVQLQEGFWDEELASLGARNALRLRTLGPNPFNRDVHPLSYGPVDQDVDVKNRQLETGEPR